MRILAKSLPPRADYVPEAVYLPGHLRSVYEAAEQLIEQTGLEQLAAVGLPASEWLEPFRRVVTLAAALHDLGKANDHFQGLLQPERFPERAGRHQGLRHEWVTRLVLNDLRLIEWLSDTLADEREWLAVLWAITGHHPAYGRPSPPTQPPSRGEGSEMRVLLESQDVQQALEGIATWFSLPSQPALEDRTLRLVGTTDVFTELTRLQRSDVIAWRGMNADNRKFVALAKVCLMGADVAGSALPEAAREEKERHRWIGAVFARRPNRTQYDALITARLTDPDTGQVHPLREFQRGVADHAGEVTLVKAGCGTGKTLAAYHWARTVCPERRLYVCYPTTGTATEGFRDYLWLSHENRARAGAELVHGRAAVDQDIILGTTDVGGVSETDLLDARTASRAQLPESQDPLLRIESLAAWSTPMVSCTVDTVLGLIQNNRRGLYSWPAFSGAAFVFDEVHAYDSNLFGALLRFLADIRGVPVLLMTASLPNARLDALRSTLDKREGELAVPPTTPDLEALELLPRYHLDAVDDQTTVQQRVLDELARGGKVLWVCNTVQRAMDAADQCREAVVRPILYHSRFRYEDRVARHARVVEAFRQPGATLAITTQVAEMSLDLSATLLVTDLAPVPSLIQRLGRLNRRSRPGDPVRLFLVVEPRRSDGSLAALPYKENQLSDAQQWLEHLDGKNLSQRDLASAWEALQNRAEVEIGSTHVSSAWLDGGPVTTVAALRSASPGISVILSSDVPALAQREKRLMQVLLPMPPLRGGIDWKSWKQFRGVPIAPPEYIEYHPERGARWLLP